MVAIRIVPRTELPPRTEPLPACAVSFQLKLDRLMRRGNPDIGDAYSGFARFRFYWQISVRTNLTSLPLPDGQYRLCEPSRILYCVLSGEKTEFRPRKCLVEVRLVGMTDCSFFPTLTISMEQAIVAHGL